MAKTPDHRTEFAIDFDLSTGNLGGLALDAAANFPKEHPRLIGAVLGLAFGWARGMAVAHAQDGVTTPTTASKEQIGPYVALGIAAGSGVLGALGNGLRVLGQEKAGITRLQGQEDQQVMEINEYNKMGPDDFVQEYAMKAAKEGKRASQEGAAAYAAGQMQIRPEEIQKMLEGLKATRAAVVKKQVSLPLVVAGEAGQALLGVTGTVALVYYAARGMFEDWGTHNDDVLLKTLIIDGAVGAILPVAAMAKDILAVEHSSGSRGARAEDALKHLQTVGMAPKQPKKERPKLEVGAAKKKSNGQSNGFTAKVPH